MGQPTQQQDPYSQTYGQGMYARRPTGGYQSPAQSYGVGYGGGMGWGNPGNPFNINIGYGNGASPGLGNPFNGSTPYGGVGARVTQPQGYQPYQPQSYQPQSNPLAGGNRNFAYQPAQSAPSAPMGGAPFTKPMAEPQQVKPGYDFGPQAPPAPNPQQNVTSGMTMDQWLALPPSTRAFVPQPNSQTAGILQGRYDQYVNGTGNTDPFGSILNARA